VLAALLILMAITLVVTHFSHIGTLALAPTAQFAAAVVAGLGIGVVAALMGVAGGELLIPTIVVLFAVDIKIAGSLWEGYEGPAPQNTLGAKVYQNFAITDDAIIFYIGQGMWLPEVDGPQRVSVPRSELASVLA
jgi:Protein of unknown function (DUF3298)